jgi:hypothetical protein
MMAERGLDIAHTTIMGWGENMFRSREAPEWLRTQERSLVAF